MTTQPNATDDSFALPSNPVRELADEAASQSVPVDVDETIAFAEWGEAVDVVRHDIQRTLEQEVDA